MRTDPLPKGQTRKVRGAESDRGESRLGYHSSGLPKGSPFVLPEVRGFVLDAVGVSDKSLGVMR
jgi:hypothetical protein